MNKTISGLILTLMLLIALAGISMPVNALGDPGGGCDCDTKLYGTINGGVYFEQQGYSEFNEMTKTFDVPAGSNIVAARVYTGIWQGSPGKGGTFDITVNGQNSGDYQACDPCSGSPCLPGGSRCDALNWSGTPNRNLPPNTLAGNAIMHDYITGCGVQAITYDVTDKINLDASNTITVTTSTSCPNCNDDWDGRVYLIALLVIYENSAMPQITYWVNEGSIYLETGSGCVSGGPYTEASKYFNGNHIAATKVQLSSLGFPHVINTENGYTRLNGNNLGTPDIIESYNAGYNEAMVRWTNIPPSYISGTSQLLEYQDPDAFYERSCVEVLVLGISNKPDLKVNDIIFPTVMRDDTSYTISAEIENQGLATGTTFQAKLTVGGTGITKTVNVAGLGAGATTTVDFTGVSISNNGCYEFTVEVDSTGVVNEYDEGNNIEIEDYQVGNVIVVESITDFNNLVSEGLATLTSGTYYIRNLDITNCAGCGITIRNVDTNFEIENCVIHDCLEHGILLENLDNTKNKKITECTIEDNHKKGIRMQNIDHLCIDSNTIRDNDQYGIDVYLNVMPDIDSTYITITNNDLTGNLYGIELIGDNCIVRYNNIEDSGGYGLYCFGLNNKIINNTIRSSADYGIKMDNSPTTPCNNNRIYGNNLIYNTGTKQAYDSGSNTWNSPSQVTYCYNGNHYTSYIGNHWNDHISPDNNGNGIVDNSYSMVGGATDSYPLVTRWRVCGDVDGNGAPAASDAIAITQNNICTSYWHANVQPPYTTPAASDAIGITQNNLDCQLCVCCSN